MLLILIKKTKRKVDFTWKKQKIDAYKWLTLCHWELFKNIYLTIWKLK